MRLFALRAFFERQQDLQRLDRSDRILKLLLASLHACQTMADDLPIDHVPKGGEVVGAAILVLQIIGVFPHIAAKQAGETFKQDAILICGGVDFQF